MSKKKSRRDERYVFIGGGHGSYSVLRGVKDVIGRDKITTIPTIFDNGGSSGKFRKERGSVAYGDIGMHIKGLVSPDQVKPELMMLLPYRYRDMGGSFLDKVSMINALLEAYYEICGHDLPYAIHCVRNLFNVPSRILPISTGNSHLSAKLSDGSELFGEDKIDTRSNDDPRTIVSVRLVPPVEIYIKAAEAIEECDKLVICPGDFWTSFMPITRVSGFQEVVKKAVRHGVKTIAVLNLMTKKNETPGWTTADFIDHICEGLGLDSIYAAIYNVEPIDDKSLKMYELEQRYPVRYVKSDRAKYLWPVKVVEYDQTSVRHKSSEVANQLVHQ